jgi:hypothetical protein
VAGTPNFIGLIRQFYICLKQEKDLDQRTGFYNWAKSHRNDIFKKLNHVNLLAMYGSKDQVVKSVVGDYLTAILRKTQSGKENQDWKVLPMPELDHYISKECNVEAVQWTDRWMVRREMEVTAKL